MPSTRLACRFVAVLAAVWLGTGVVAAGPAGNEKVLHLPIRTDGPKSLDPVKGSTQYDNQACAQIYETLVQWKYLARPLTLEPLLLESMPTQTDNPDGTRTYRFKLKQGVRFHNDPCFPGGRGRAIVTDDVFYSFKRLADPAHKLENWWLVKDTIVGFDEYMTAQDEAFNRGRRFDYAAPVAGFRKIDDREFEIVLKQPVYRFLYTLSQFQMSIVAREAVEAYGDRLSIHPVGTGPFTVAEGDWRPGEFLILKRNPHYHECLYPGELSSDPAEAARDKALGFDKPAGRRLPLADRIEITFYVPDAAMWLDFQNGKLGYTQVPSEYFEEAFNRRTRKLRKDYAEKGIVDHAVPLYDFIFRGFNMEDPVFGGYGENKVKLRRALSLAFDLDELNDTFYNNICTVYDGPIPPGLDGFPKDGKAPLNFRGPRLDEARRLLAEAGYPEGRGLDPIEYYTDRSALSTEMSQAEQRMLGRIGVKVNVRLVDFSELIEAINEKKAQMFGFAWGSDYPDAENNLALFYSKNKAPGANHYNYDRPEFDALYRRILVMSPGPERTALYERMRDMIIADAPFVGSMGRTRFYLVQPWLKNFKPTEDFHNWCKYLDVDESTK